MLNRILGIIIIAIAGFTFWIASDEPSSGKNQVLKAKPNIISNLLQRIKVRLDPDTQTPLYKTLKPALESDENLKSCFGNFRKIQISSQLHDQDIEIGIERSFGKILLPNPDSQQGCDMEVEIFDTTQPENAKGEENTRAWKTSRSSAQNLDRDIVLQLSIFKGDGATRNKIAESGLNIPYAIFAESKFAQKKTR